MPNVSDIIKHPKFRLLTAEHTLQQTFTEAYATDLVSMIIKHSKHEPLFITQINADATLAVAIMLHLPAIILTEDKTFNESLLERANKEDIAVITTSLTAVQVVIELTRMALL